MEVKVNYRIWEVRTEKNLTLEQLATLSGISKTTINDIENGKKDTTVTTLCKLAKTLNIEPEKLYNYKIYD